MSQAKEVTWPEVGSTWRDVRIPERTLLVQVVQRESSQQRHVIGTVKYPNGEVKPYSASIMTFEIIWRPL